MAGGISTSMLSVEGDDQIADENNDSTANNAEQHGRMMPGPFGATYRGHSLSPPPKAIDMWTDPNLAALDPGIYRVKQLNLDSATIMRLTDPNIVDAFRANAKIIQDLEFGQHIHRRDLVASVQNFQARQAKAHNDNLFCERQFQRDEARLNRELELKVKKYDLDIKKLDDNINTVRLRGELELAKLKRGGHMGQGQLGPAKSLLWGVHPATLVIASAILLAVLKLILA
ncbi:hypothetical protein QBC44DRAFT_382513 [Cladorrhinum sp. PSN332]|nr:hypothetical protein QBC44DRAFT_382513 [Cladorrhinum sp. PSN332]